MKDSGFDFFCFSYIPEVFAKLTAGTSCDIHFLLIFVVALWTFPFKIIVDGDFAIVAADLAVIGFCIEFRILDIVIDEFYNLLQSFEVISHIWNFNIGNCSAV